MTETQCPVCSSSRQIDVGEYRSESQWLSTGRKVKCIDCELVFRSPIPNEKEWSDYNAHYFDRAHGGSTGDSRPRLFRGALANIRARHVANFVQQNGVSVEKVLEIGPGYGEFAKSWMTRFPGVEYAAVETDSSVHNTLTRLGVELIGSLSNAERTVDMIVVSHVLEHTLSPIEFLTSLQSKLRRGGVLFVEVPCQDFIYKTVDEPHTLFFNMESMSCLLGQLDFRDCELSHHGESHRQLISELNAGPLARILGKVRRRLTGRFFQNKLAQDVADPLSNQMWAVIQPFEAHIEKSEPARWLRLLAIKS